MKLSKPLVAILIFLLLLAVALSDLSDTFSLNTIKQNLHVFSDYRDANPFRAALYFLLLYVAVTTLSIPGAAVLTLVAGALFGFWEGLVLVSFASSIGATLAFSASRYLLRDWVQARFGKHLTSLNRGFEKDGAFYLFSLRLAPVFPFFMINVLMGLTPITVHTFYLVSQLGMLAGTAVYINAGKQLSAIDAVQDIMSPTLFLSFCLLGFFPLLGRYFLPFISDYQKLRSVQKPQNFDRNLIVIGAGAAGLVSAYIAATVKAKVTLIEKENMGGDCLNTGCVPSKSLIRAANLAHSVRQAQKSGISTDAVNIDFSRIMAHIRQTIEEIAPHDSVERYTDMGVECLCGEASIVSPYAVAVNGKTLTTRNIIIASGAKPAVPPIPGLSAVDFHTSDTIWTLTTLPENLVVLGGGAIGCELSQAFARLGSKVTQIEMLDRLLANEDEEASKLIQQSLQQDGVDILLNHKATRVWVSDKGQKRLSTTHPETGLRDTTFDVLLIAVGRTANTGIAGLEALGIEKNPNGTLTVNEFLQTSVPTIFACGDVVGPYQFTHVAAHQAWYASVNSLFGFLKKFQVDYRVIPKTTFTSPEVASVGLNRVQAEMQNIPFEETRYELADLDRAIIDRNTVGFVKKKKKKNSD
ncbi:MAG: FAD-dependent oxidoreductase, partial [Pseudomonadales bacterium]|nr:FAD-dependent oxidoreductase [Pseudomonadales bacterium]